jgi:glucose-6-phosphate 1-dehydrogenase
MPPEARIIGAARTQQSARTGQPGSARRWRNSFPPKRARRQHVAEFLERLDYLAVDAKGEGGWSDLCDKMRPDAVQAFYFSVAPGLFGDLAERLHQFKIARQDAGSLWKSPSATTWPRARALNRTLSEYFDETQIYRIDHYLGKETVQNLMAVRFGNVLFEPLWNNQYVDHVQITVAEEVGVGGRGAYYDQSGAMRDMVQNHLMQLLCLTAMEPPSKFDPDAVRDEKLKVIRALDPVAPEDIVRGQYKGRRGRGLLPGGRRKPESRTESFIALKLHVSNWRWNGTPFYLRTGKRLKARKSEIVIHFKEPPHSIFDEDAGSRHNVLSIRLQPDEGIDLRVTIKEPGPGGMRLMDVPLDMSFADALGADGADVPDAYERLIMDVIRGNQTLFMRGDEVEAAWAWTDPIIEGWTRRGDRPAQYEPGSSGPEEALMLLHRDGRRWREIGG